MNYLKSLLYYQGSIYSQLRKAGDRMRKDKIHIRSSFGNELQGYTSLESMRMMCSDFYAYKAKEEPDVIGCNGSCC